MTRIIRLHLFLFAVIVVAFLCPGIVAQENLSLRAAQDTLPPPAGTIRMTLQGDVKLDALVGFISQRIGIKYAYDDKIASRTITIRTPQEIPDRIPACPARKCPPYRTFDHRGLRYTWVEGDCRMQTEWHGMQRPANRRRHPIEKTRHRWFRRSFF